MSDFHEILVCQCCMHEGFPKWVEGLPNDIICDDANECLERVYGGGER